MTEITTVEELDARCPDAPASSAEVGEVSPIESQRTNSEDREVLVRAAAENVRRVGASNVASVIEATLDVALTAHHPAPVTPTQYATALEDPALRRIAENARFGVGEVIDHVLRALGVPAVAPVMSAEQVMNARDAADEAGPPDEAEWCVLFLRALGIEVQDRG